MRVSPGGLDERVLEEWLRLMARGEERSSDGLAVSPEVLPRRQRFVTRPELIPWGELLKKASESRRQPEALSASS